jgi:hypothetical protein
MPPETVSVQEIPVFFYCVMYMDIFSFTHRQRDLRFNNFLIMKFVIGPLIEYFLRQVKYEHSYRLYNSVGKMAALAR